MSVEAFALSFFDPDRDLYGTARSGATLLFHGRQPAAHARDIRSELLVKVALLERVGADPQELLRAQHERLAPVADGLAGQVRTTTGSDHVVALWRHESVCATLRFLDALLATVPAQRASLPG